MRTRFYLLIGVLVIVSSLLTAQEKGWSGKPGEPRMMKINADGAVILREIGAVITEEKGTIKVAFIPPGDRAPKELQKVDLQPGDEVGMVAGKRIKAIKELREAYEKAGVGSEFKIGVRRDGNPHIVTFVKKDEKDLPAGGQMVIRRGPREADENSDFFPAFGIGIEKKGTDIVISETLPHAPKELKKGDVVRTLNGKGIKTIADFNEAFGATNIGSELVLGVVRNGEAHTIKGIRPEPKPMIIRKTAP